MHYMVMLKKGDEPDYYEDSLLAPNSAFDGLAAVMCQESGLCDMCAAVCDQNRKCHVMRQIKKNTWDKLCPILFHDAVKPDWKPSDLV